MAGLSDRLGIYSIAWGYLVGFGLSLVFQFAILLNGGMQFQMAAGSDMGEVISFLRKSAPLLLLTSASQINVLVERSIASRLPVGSLSALNFANKINRISVDICIIPILTVLLPTISGAFARGDLDSLMHRIRRSAHSVLLILIPITIFIVVFRTQIVGIFFQRGVFDASATAKTSSALLLYSIGLAPHGLYLLMIYIYLAAQATLYLGVIGAASAIVNIILNVTLVRPFGYHGIAIAWSGTALIYLAMLFVVAKRRVLHIRLTDYLRPLYSVGFGSILLAVFLYLVGIRWQPFADFGARTAFLISSLLGVVLYAATLYLVRDTIVVAAVEALRAKLSATRQR